MAIVAGSVAERVAGDERLRNTSVAFDRDGRQVAVYRKIHQFDVDLPGQRVRESDTDAPGTGGAIARARRPPRRPHDLLRPALPRALPRLRAWPARRSLTVPAAFLERTGRDHWEVLLRARAIENQCFVVGRQPARRAARGPHRLRALDDHRSLGHGARTGPRRAGSDRRGVRPRLRSRACARRCRRSRTGARRRTASRPDLRVAAVALAVGLVLADASVVILALPAIYREYNAEVADVAWVVTAFNLAIALAAVPAARLATRLAAGRVCAGGLVVFAGGVGGLRARALARLPDRRARRAGRGRRRGGVRRARAAARTGRRRAPCGARVGDRRHRRRCARPGGRRPAHPADLVAVDLRPAGAARADSRARRLRPRRARRRRRVPGCRTSRPTSRSGCCRRASPRCSSCSCCCSSRAGACRRSRPRSSSR